jgi:uncharacterized protein YkwD
MRTALVFAAAFAALVSAASAAFAACSLPSDAEAMRGELVRLVNAERRERGLPALRPSEGLMRASLGHACDMVEENFFSHQGSNRSTPRNRVRAEGLCTRLTAENIAMGWPSAARVFRDWMGSAAHRTNILADVDFYGIAVVAPQPGQGGGPRWVLTLVKGC